VTLPTSDAQSARFLPRRPRMVPQTHSIPVIPQIPFPSTPSPATGYRNETQHEHALDLATHSLDLATGGLKTLTAKRELPVRQDRRVPDITPDTWSTTRSYTLILVVLSCVVLMLIGGGIALFAMLQP